VAIVLLLVPAIGTTGYIVIEGWSFIDALYMSVITITTIGFTEVQPLSTEGRVFTIVLAIAGIGAIFYGLVSLFAFFLEGELATLLGVQRMKERIESLEGHYILCGYGRVGSEIARQFSDRKVPFVVVESSPETLREARTAGYLVVEGDAAIDVVLQEAGIERAKGLLAAADSDAGNTFIALTAKALNPDVYVVSRAGRAESTSRMLRAGADRAISPYRLTGRRMALSALQPLVLEFIDAVAAGRHGEQMLAEIQISEESGLVGRTVGEVMRTCPGATVLGVQGIAGSIKVGPSATVQMQAGDRLIVLGEEAELEAIRPARKVIRGPSA
jgi:voltage-gated potassium channel